MLGRNTGDSVTERAVGAYSQIADPRLREIITALIKHLHALVKEVRLTGPEWELAWDLMATMAAVTGPGRNELILLADVIGLSQLIEVINHDRPDSAVGFLVTQVFVEGGEMVGTDVGFTASDNMLGRSSVTATRTACITTSNASQASRRRPGRPSRRRHAWRSQMTPARRSSGRGGWSTRSSSCRAASGVIFSARMPSVES
jgi:catechol 1,2-dioxygenase